MSLTTFFLARAEKADLGTTIRKRIPYLIWLDILLFIYFPVSSFAKMRSDPKQYSFFFLNASVIAVGFLVSLAIIGRSHIHTATYITMFSVLAEVGNLALFIPVATWIDLYRVGVFLIVVFFTGTAFAEGLRAGALSAAAAKDFAAELSSELQQGQRMLRYYYGEMVQEGHI
jgi:hypothetical protein